MSRQGSVAPARANAINPLAGQWHRKSSLILAAVQRLNAKPPIDHRL
jgi:hypothetical protein